jgi:hypothetical protein
LRTPDIKQARRRHRAVADEIEAEWDRLRFALEIEGARSPQQPVRLISLSQKDVHGLAGEFYREFVAAHSGEGIGRRSRQNRHGVFGCAVPVLLTSVEAEAACDSDSEAPICHLS